MHTQKKLANLEKELLVLKRREETNRGIKEKT